MTGALLGDVTVLVVDDSPTKRYLLTSWLKRAGYAVVEAETGAAALATLGEHRVDLVVLDVRLPDLSGFEVCERIKADPRYAAIPVVHVSAHAVDVSDRARGLDRGADAYLVEPIEPEELIATAQAVLRYYQARHRAELLAHRLSVLAQTTLAMNAAATLPALLQAAATGAARIHDSPAVVAAVSMDGVALAAVTTGPSVEPVVREWSVPDGDIATGSLLRTDPAERWPLADWAGAPELKVVAARLRADRAPVFAAVPAGSVMAGAPALIQLGQAVASAVEAQRSFDEEHRIAVTLQRSLLPPSVPTVPGLDMAFRYEPASMTSEVGGDFYELSPIGRRLIVAIGDVAGHSLHAATVMAELRHALRAYAVEGHRPAAVLDRLNQLMRTLLPAETATLCLLELDIVTGAVRMASAGHPPPLLITADGGRRFITEHGALLGVAARRRDDHEFTLPHGATLVLYTDGLVERRTIDFDVRLEALSEAAATVDADLDRFCERLLVELGARQADDDVAVVALRRN